MGRIPCGALGRIPDASVLQLGPLGQIFLVSSKGWEVSNQSSVPPRKAGVGEEESPGLRDNLGDVASHLASLGIDPGRLRTKLGRLE